MERHRRHSAAHLRKAETLHASSSEPLIDTQPLHSDGPNPYELEHPNEAADEDGSDVEDESESELDNEDVEPESSNIVVAVQPRPRKKTMVISSSQETYNDHAASPSTYESPSRKSRMARELRDLRRPGPFDSPLSSEPPTKRHRMNEKPSPRRLRERNPLMFGYTEKQLLPDLDQMLDEAVPFADSVELLDLNKLQPLADRAAEYGVSEQTIRKWDAEQAVFDDDRYYEDVDEDADYLPIGLGGTIPSQSHHPEPVDPETQSQPIFERIQQPTSRDDDMQTFLDALQRGWFELIDKLLEKERRIRAYSEKDIKLAKYQVYYILISMHSSIVKSHMQGDLARQYLVDAETRGEIDKLLIALIEEHYLVYGDPDIATEIDNFRAPYSTAANAQRGYRKYFVCTRRDGTRYMSRKRIDILRLFCERLSGRLSKISGDDADRPLMAALVEVGFSIYVFRRLANHRAHRGSNFIQNIFESVCHHLFGDKFGIHQHIIYLGSNRMQGSLAETILTRICQGYVFNAGGFSFHPAGQNNSSGTCCDSKRFTVDQYATWRSWALENSSVRENHEAYGVFLAQHADEPAAPARSQSNHESGVGNVEAEVHVSKLLRFDRALQDLLEDW
ncbi:hypothetical protein M409DRAFT_55361 [Zasmidium cellare ATCC 36951]|uniref:Uncharacterized protein n=1 Tax=Zasmidium cellare ATCC 36951 TaxID=1080233 RepID=A0A6A6CJX4_ZASCE|nr:uncharacterized protein M409DRAFT_55361 [Zasmidium cellare ATCC 36951]KAF2166009.1 hypothetical protein M409DRAFT_55361 [Zasmidium cellare ATCC 36951]